MDDTRDVGGTKGEAVDGFFVATPDGLMPNAVARSPWSASMLHGRLLAGLAAREVEADHLPAGFTLSRLTVDMFRSPKLEPVTVRASRVRDGNRVRAVDVVMSSGGVDVARASALLMKQTEEPDARVWSAPAWDVARPGDVPLAAIGAASGPMAAEARRFTIDGDEATPRRGTWLRDVVPLVAGEALSPLVRVAMAADTANPLANNGPEGLQFINADLTLLLVRSPGSEWIGLETTGHDSAHGLAVGRCDVYDLQGRIGHVTVAAVANSSSR